MDRCCFTDETNNTNSTYLINKEYPMAKIVKSHYSPIFSNKVWADGKHYIKYEINSNDYLSGGILKEPVGYKKWGRKKGLYSIKLETLLANNLENKVAPIYQQILAFEELDNHKRMIWSQFLLSQMTRTPTYMRYEKNIKEILNINYIESEYYKIGSEKSWDIGFVANRDWHLLIAHKDDYFIRTDNPVLLSGFIRRPETCLFYPLKPNLCFVACSMQDDWNPFLHIPLPIYGHELDKGAAHVINFHLARLADKSLIVSPLHDDIIGEEIFQNLGVYPQPPFSMHFPFSKSEVEDAFESIRKIMSITDEKNYPSWLPFELEPYYSPVIRECFFL